MRRVVAYLLVVGACSMPPAEGDCIYGAEGCVCASDEACATGLACVDSVCVDPCPGGLGCACLAGGCDGFLECVDATCQLVCAARTGDCNGLAADGCESDLMTDHANCSVCGSACPAGQSCTIGRCVTMIAADQASPVDIKVDDTHVYWLNQGSTDEFGNPAGDATVARVALAGGDPEVLATGVVQPGRLGLGDGWVYWTEGNGFARAPREGGAREALPATSSWIGAFVVTETHLYWSGGSATLERMPKDGSASPEVVVAGEGAWSLAQDDTHLYYWRPSGFYALAKSAGAPVQLLDAPEGPAAMTCDAGTLYWIDHAVGVLHRMDIDGSNHVELSGPFDVPPTPERIALDAANVYWVGDAWAGEPGAEWQVSEVRATPRSGGATQTVIAFDLDPWWAPMLAASDAGLFLAIPGDPAASDGAIVRIETP